MKILVIANQCDKKHQRNKMDVMANLIKQYYSPDVVNIKTIIIDRFEKNLKKH